MRLCSIDGCETKHMARGWCTKHYKRWLNHGDPNAEVREFIRGPRKCVTDGCANPKSVKAGKGLCQPCYSREYRDANRDQLIANYKAWRESRGSRWATMPEEERNKYRAYNARRRAIRSGRDAFEVTSRDIDRLRVRQAGACAYCASKCALEIDHVVPLAAGGKHALGNLVLACPTCNRSKGSATVTEWKFALARGLSIPKRLYDGRTIIEGQTITA